MEVRAPSRIFLAIFGIATTGFFILPMMLTNGTLIGLDGNITVIDHMRIWSALDPVSEAFYLYGDMFCHQMTSHSFILNGNQMAICARDLGIFVGIVIGLISIQFLPDRIYFEKRFVVFPAMSAIMLATDWYLQNISVYFSNEMRFVTGILVGFFAALVVHRLILQFYYHID